MLYPDLVYKSTVVIRSSVCHAFVPVVMYLFILFDCFVYIPETASVLHIKNVIDYRAHAYNL
jgi:hypothetical protein